MKNDNISLNIKKKIKDGIIDYCFVDECQLPKLFENKCTNFLNENDFCQKSTLILEFLNYFDLYNNDSCQSLLLRDLAYDEIENLNGKMWDMKKFIKNTLKNAKEESDDVVNQMFLYMCKDVEYLPEVYYEYQSYVDNGIMRCKKHELSNKLYSSNLEQQKIGLESNRSILIFVKP